MLCCPYAILPPLKLRDHCQLGPTNLQEWLQERVAIPAWVHYEHRWGRDYKPGLGLPLGCFTSDEQGHLVAHWMCNLPTTVLAKHSEPRDVWLCTLCTQCLLCESGQRWPVT